MIETILTNEGLPINPGEGAASSPPPTSPEVKIKAPAKIGIGQVKKDAEVDFSPEIQKSMGSGNRDGDEGDAVDKELSETIERLNAKLGRLDREIRLKVDQRIGKRYVSVVDKESQEVIREFPPEEIRAFIARFMEFNEKLAANTDLRSLIVNLEV